MAYTFTTLKQAIQDYTENTETTFVNNLSRLYKTLKSDFTEPYKYQVCVELWTQLLLMVKGF